MQQFFYFSLVDLEIKAGGHKIRSQREKFLKSLQNTYFQD